MHTVCVVVTAALFWLLLPPAHAAETHRPAAGGQFLAVSDIHFDPFYDPSLVAQLVAADVSQWETIFATSAITTVSPRGQDSNYPLLRSALAEMQQRLPANAFILISGDFMSHDFSKNFQNYAPDKSQAAYQAFVTKTIQFVARAFQQAFPGTRLLPTLGNNDSDCGDYAIEPHGAFLAAFREAWRTSVDSQSFNDEFGLGGYYTTALPESGRTRLIALNTVFFSTKYKNTCGTPGSDPGMQELGWLDAQLRAAARKKEHVWLLLHIPPGIDVFDTIESGSQCPTPQMFLKTPYAEQYLRLVDRYRAVIVGTFAGHTHMDDFRVLQSQAKRSAGYIHISPSISPIFGNNPAFEVVSFDSKHGITDYTAYNLQLGDATPTWGYEYNFRNAYAQPTYNAATLRQVMRAIGSNPTTRATYLNYFTAASAQATAKDTQSWRGYWCGIGAMSAEAFTACYCPSSSPTADSIEKGSP